MFHNFLSPSLFLKNSFLIFSTLLVIMANCSKPPKKKIDILTGINSGNYHKAAIELNDVLKDTQYELNVKESEGSLANILEVGKGNTPFGFAQYDAIILNALYKGEENKKLVNQCYVLFPMSPEYIHIIVRKNSEIKTITDLKEKRISVGAVNSGTWISAFIISKAFGNFDISQKKDAAALSVTEAIDQLLTNKLDAIFFTSMLGVPTLQHIPEQYSDRLQILSLGNNFPIPDNFQKIYGILRLPANTYPWQKEDVYTLATYSYLLANSEYDKNEIREFAKVIFNNAPQLRSQSVLWNSLNLSYISQEIRSGIPYHPGIVEYVDSK